jgi:hypothetical protein
VKSVESDESYSEVYLTGVQGLEIVRRVFEKAGQDMVDIMVRRIREVFVRKPSPTLDGSMSYVSIMNMLDRMVEAFGKYDGLELRKMLTSIQISPRLDGKKFRGFLLKLAPTLSDGDISELYRVMTMAGTGKTTMPRRKFRKAFETRSLLSSENAVDVLAPVGKMTPEFEAARQRWNELQPILDGALETKEQDPTVAHAQQSLRMEMDNVSSSLTCLDVVGVHRHLLACVMSYQKLLWTIQKPEISAMDRVTTAVRGILQI